MVKLQDAYLFKLPEVGDKVLAFLNKTFFNELVSSTMKVDVSLSQDGSDFAITLNVDIVGALMCENQLVNRIGDFALAECGIGEDVTSTADCPKHAGVSTNRRGDACPCLWGLCRQRRACHRRQQRCGRTVPFWKGNRCPCQHGSLGLVSGARSLFMDTTMMPSYFVTRGSDSLEILRQPMGGTIAKGDSR